MPLTASGGANAVNSREEDGSGEQQQLSTAEGGLPAVKKPKGVEKSTKAQLAKKKALKRL
jgi:hypothetical protein